MSILLYEVIQFIIKEKNYHGQDDREIQDLISQFLLLTELPPSDGKLLDSFTFYETF